MAYNYNFDNFYKGDYISYTIVIGGGPASLSGYVIELAVKENKNATSNTLLFSSSEGGLTIVDASTLSLYKSSADLSGIDAGAYYYDLQVTDTSNNVSTWMYGRWIFNEDVTR